MPTTITADTLKTGPYEATGFIQEKTAIKPLVGIILGSGLGDFVEFIENPIVFPYNTLSGFPTPSVHGHEGNLIIGHVKGVPVACLQGRSHFYEGQGHNAVKTYVRTLKLLGCEYFIATNASGSLREEVGPGELVLITDHINMQSTNPLIGKNDDDFGPRFLPLDNAYDLTMREKIKKVAQDIGILLHEGVYIAVSGPQYETAAEIRAFKQMGADAVGMSTVPEVLVARHCGLKVMVIASITNYATGLTSIAHDHNKVVETAQTLSSQLNRLITAFIQTLL